MFSLPISIVFLRSSIRPVSSFLIMKPHKLIIDSIRNYPEQWRFDGYNFSHFDSGLEFRVGSFIIFRVSERSSLHFSFGLIAGWQLWKAYRGWQKHQIEKAFSVEQSNV